MVGHIYKYCREEIDSNSHAESIVRLSKILFVLPLVGDLLLRSRWNQVAEPIPLSKLNDGRWINL
jgi:hypothetical protein